MQHLFAVPLTLVLFQDARTQQMNDASTRLQAVQQQTALQERERAAANNTYTMSKNNIPQLEDSIQRKIQSIERIEQAKVHVSEHIEQLKYKLDVSPCSLAFGIPVCGFDDVFSAN